MTRRRRFAASVCAVVLGFVALGVWTWVLETVAPGPWVSALSWTIGSFVVFGLTVGACYTWAVDGRFVRSRG